MPLDIGIGILVALGCAETFSAHASLLLVLFGIACALLPDIDIVTLPLLGRWHHRSYTHYPIVYVPLVILAFLLLPSIYAAIFSIAVYAHLVHDTFGIGWGVAWLWPFSGRRFLLFPEKSRGLPSSALVVWEADAQPQPENLAGERDWIRQYYFQPNTVAYIEYGTLAAALLALIAYYA